MFRAAVLAFVSLAAGQTPARDSGVPAPTGTASISGTVVAASDQRPIAYARVSLNSPDRVGDRLTYANANGEFAFPKLAAGSYRVSSDATGYLGMSLGQTQPGRAGVLQVIAAGEERKGLKLALHKGGVVSGRVLGPDGRPLVGVRASALRMSWRADGVREFGLNASAVTDDRGEYRIVGLLAGNYVIEVMPTYIEGYRSAALDGVQVLATEAFVPTFFPGAIDPGGAIPITVEIDAERPGVDFILTPTPLAEIRGRVEGAGQSLELARVSLRPPSQAAGGVLSDSDTRARSTVTRPDGRFLLEAVAPGDYELIASQHSQKAEYVGMARITVSGRNVSDASIVMHPTITISGEQLALGTAAPFPSVTLKPIDGFMSFRNSSLVGQSSGPGRFSITNVPPGRYIIGVTASAPASWYQSSVDVGDVRLAGNLIEVGTADINGVRITYRSGMAEVSGTIRREDQSPVSEYSLVIFPADRKDWPAWMTGAASVEPDSSGRYMKALKPGSYLIAAVHDVAYNQWLDPEFLETLVKSATPIKLAEGQKLSQDFVVK